MFAVRARTALLRYGLPGLAGMDGTRPPSVETAAFVAGGASPHTSFDAFQSGTL
jgi:hypothetical protein